MPFIIRPNGETDLANATIHGETTLPQTISGLAAGSYEIGRVEWNSNAVTVTVSTPAPAFTAQPSISPDPSTVGDTINLSLGTATNSTSLTIEVFTLGGVDKTGDVSGNQFDTAGETAGAFSFQVRASGPGGTVLSNVISGTLQAGASGGASVITEDSFTEVTGAWAIQTDSPSQGNYHWARFADGITGVTPDGSGGWSSAPQESGTIAVGASGDALEIPETGVTGIDYELFLYQRIGSDDSNVLTTGYTGDSTAPVLSSLLLEGQDSQLTFAISTDDGQGTLHSVVTTTAGPTAQQIIEGTAPGLVEGFAAPVTATGRQPTQTADNLANGTTYYASIVHVDLRGNVSNVITGSVEPGIVATVPLAHQRSTELLSDSTTTTTYTGAGFTPQAGTDRLLIISAKALGQGPRATTVSLNINGGAYVATQADTDKIGDINLGIGPANSRGHVCQFIVKEADIIDGPNTPVITFDNDMRACVITVHEFVGVNQLQPVLNATSAVNDGVRITPSFSNSGVFVEYSARQGNSPNSALPVTITQADNGNNVVKLLEFESGTTNSNDIVGTNGFEIVTDTVEYDYDITKAGSLGSASTSAIEVRAAQPA